MIEGWFPIETADKDGTRLLLMHEPSALIVIGHWEETAWMREYYAPAEHIQAKDASFHPTHWLPLSYLLTQIKIEHQTELMNLIREIRQIQNHVETPHQKTTLDTALDWLIGTANMIGLFVLRRNQTFERELAYDEKLRDAMFQVRLLTARNDELRTRLMAKRNTLTRADRIFWVVAFLTTTAISFTIGFLSRD